MFKLIDFKILSVVFLVLAILCFSFLKNKGKEIDPLNSSIVLGYYIGDHFISIGSGTYVKSKIGKGIITAKHVAEELKNKEQVGYCNYFGDCDFIKNKNYISESSNDIEYDWAFYIGKIENIKSVDINKNKLKIRENVESIGNAWGFMPSVVMNNVAWVNEKSYILEGFAAPGCSGGGVFLNKKLAGIVVAIHQNELGPQTNQVLVVPIVNVSIF